MKKLTIVVLNYNASVFLDACLASLERAYNLYPKFDTLVIDNASTDDSVSMVSKKYPKIQLIESTTNLGFAGGNNLGVPYIKHKYVLFLNPDTVVPENTLPEMLKLMEENPEIGVATCQIKLAKGGLDLDCHRGFPTPWAAFTYFSGLAKVFPTSKLFNQYHQGYKDLATLHEIDSCVGAFMLVRTKAVGEVGWWDSDYFFYGEDLDWNYRFKQKGWKVMYNPAVSIVHYKGISSGLRKESAHISTANLETKKRSAVAAAKAMEIFYAKHYKNKYPIVVNKLVLLAVKLILLKRIMKVERQKLKLKPTLILNNMRNKLWKS